MKSQRSNTFYAMFRHPQKMTISLTKIIQVFLAFALIITLFASPYQVQRARAASIWWGEFQEYATFGPNATIQMSGEISDGCFSLIAFTAKVFVGPHGTFTLGQSTEAQPNAVIVTSLSGGLFLDQTIGFTKPTGSLGTGNYDVAMSLSCVAQDQNVIEFIAGTDQPRGAFSVVIPSDIPPLPSDDIIKVKESAKDEAIKWTSLIISIKGLELIDKIGQMVEVIIAPTAGPLILFETFVYGFIDATLPGYTRLKQGAEDVFASLSDKYAAIYRDPPDPDFARSTILQAFDSFQAPIDKPLSKDAAETISRASVERALSEALLKSIERYQGAEVAGNADWAYVHALEIQHYSMLLRQTIASRNAGLQNWRDELFTRQGDLDSILQSMRSFRDQIVTTGLSADDRRYLANQGLSSADIDTLISYITNWNPNNVSITSIINNMDALVGSGVDTETQLSQLEIGVQSNIDQLHPQLTMQFPNANSGGPYLGQVGSTVVFDGSASSDPQGELLQFSWDLDGDGLFDDGVGPTATFVFDLPRTGLIGLRVVNPTDLEDVAYAPITVTTTNQPPIINTFSPSEGALSVLVGSNLDFTVSASDPNADQLSISWAIDGSLVGSGNTFTYAPDASLVGLHSLGAMVSDGMAQVSIGWAVSVAMPDLDGDGWNSNVDCNDADSTVNPGMAEIIGNGKDDDCNPTSLDTGSPPSADFHFTPAVGIVGESVQFTDVSIDPNQDIASWAWDFENDGTIDSVLQSPLKTYDTGGSFDVTLIVTDGQGNTNSTTKALRVTSPPIAGFTYVPTNPSIGSSTQFTDTSTDPDGTITDWHWQFGDGGSNDLQNPTYTFFNPGTFDVTLTVTDNDGVSRSVTQAIMVSNVPRTLYNPLSSGRNVALLEIGATVHSFSSQWDSNHSPQAMLNYAADDFYPWATGNGQIDNQWVKILLKDGKTYLIDRVMVMPRSSCCADQRVKDFAVDVSTTTADDSAFTTVLNATAENNGNLQEFILPHPVFAKYVRYRPINNRGATNTISTQQFKVMTGQEGGSTVTFQDLSTDPDNDIVSWNWDFRDGTTSTEQNPTHTFPDPGTYIVTLTVMDSQFHTSAFSLSYTVLAQPVADFTFYPATPNEGQSVTFTDTSSDPNGALIVKRTWNWGDGSSSTVTAANTAQHAFPDNDTYIVTLEVANDADVVAQVQQSLSVANLPPTASAGSNLNLFWGQNWTQNLSANPSPNLSPTVGDPGSADRASLTCDWYFGDNQTAQVLNCNNSNAKVAHTYANPGTYIATLTVTDKDGASTSDSLTVLVGKRKSLLSISSVPNNTTVNVTAHLTDLLNPANSIAGKSLTFRLGSQTASATTDANGMANALLTFTPGIENSVTVTFIGDNFYHGTSDTSFFALKAIPVPWRGNLPHDSYNGQPTILKAVVKGGSAPWSYTWNFGDGSPTVNGTTSDPNVIEASHVYPDSPAGTPFIATLTVNSGTETASGTYRIVVRPATLDVKVNVAIDDALWYLHKQLRRDTYPDGADYGWVYSPRGSWHLAPTAAFVEAMENQGHHLGGDPNFDPYVEDVQRGLNYILANMQVVPITLQPAGDPDSNGNGIGLLAYTGSDEQLYMSSLAMLALASGTSPEMVATTGNSFYVTGRTYMDIVRDMTDHMAWAQNDSGVYAGGWRYWDNYGTSDMSVTQWPVIALMAAENNWGVAPPSWVKELLRDNFLPWVQNSNGGFGYDSPWNWVNVAKTGAGLAALAWVGVPSSDPHVTSAINFIGADANWYNNNYSYTNIGDFYTMYAVMKGARLTNPSIVQFTTHDWYGEYAVWLVNHRSADGHWTDTSWLSASGYIDSSFATAWGVLVLTPTVFTPPPVAILKAAPNPTDVGIDITFNGSASYDANIPPKNIVSYTFDFGDGSQPITNDTGVVTHQYLEYGQYSVTLIVNNDADPSQYSAPAIVVVDVVPPDHPPVAVPGGPYVGYTGVPVTLDGSASYDIDEPYGDAVSKWEWELDLVAPYGFNEASGDSAKWTWTTPGTYDIGLKVTDKEGLWSNSPLSDIAWTTITILPGIPTSLVGEHAVVGYGDTINLRARLEIQATHDPVAGQALTFCVDVNRNAACDPDEVEGTVMTEADGWASLSYTANLTPQGYTYFVDFAGDDPYLPNNGSFGLQVTLETTFLTISTDPVQYSDSLTLSAQLTDDDSSPNALSGKVVEFFIDGDSVGTGTTDLSGKTSVNLVIDLPVGDYEVLAIFEGDAYFAPVTESYSLTVAKEDARSTYAGPMLVSTGCGDCSTATVPLRATIQDISAVPGDPAYDEYPGDITNATVSFVNRDQGNAVLCSANIVLFDPADPTSGTATCDWSVDIGNSDGNDYTVGIIVGGYYTRDSSEDDTLVVVSKPTSYFITGGGYLINHNSAGVYAGDDGLKTNFGLNVKFNKKLTNLQGRVTILVRQDGHVYKIKSNVLSSLVVIPYEEGDQSSGKAEILGKASIENVTDPLFPISLDGNASMQVTVKDNGEPGSGDLIGISIWSKDGDLLFSNSWSGVETIEQVLDGGNLQVH